VNDVVVPDSTRFVGTEPDVFKNSVLAANVKTADVPVMTIFVGVKGVSTKDPVPAAGAGEPRARVITIVEPVVPAMQVCIPLRAVKPAVVTPDIVIMAPAVRPWAADVVRLALPVE
jgi:hypothetical protein